MDALTVKKLTKCTQEILVKNNAILVKKIAHHLIQRLPPIVQVEDLIQAGMLGLLEAVRNYDDSKGASFETYASIRIRGHMIDEVRRNDWLPRSVYKNARLVAEATKAIENREGREAKDVEIAAELNISLDEYFEIVSDTVNGHIYGFDDLGVEDDDLHGNEDSSYSEPYRNVLNDDIQTLVRDIVDTLPNNERLVLYLYYNHDLNLKEIGSILSVSESRVSQLHSQATSRVKSQLTM